MAAKPSSARLQSALLGSGYDGPVPVSLFPGIVATSETERTLRNAGVCLLDHTRVVPWILREPGIERRVEVAPTPTGARLERTTIDTGSGVLRFADRFPASHPLKSSEFLPWRVEFPFASQADYEPLALWIESRDYSADHETYLRRIKEAGGDFLFIPWLGYSPVQELVINLMGIERFSFEWAEHRSQVCSLMETIESDIAKKSAIAIQSEASIFALCGNIAPSLLGPDLIRDHIFPVLNRFGALLHQAEKRLLCHFDGGTRLISDQIRDSAVDIVEAFTLRPEGDHRLADALQEWPDTVISVHIPGSYFRGPKAELPGALEAELGPGLDTGRVVVGITETLPPAAFEWGLREMVEYLGSRERK